MRGWPVFGCVGAMLTAAAACATSDESAGPRPPPPGTGTIPIADASTDAVARDADAEASIATCSAANWCATPLPDAELAMKDIWPFSGRAFAIAEGPTLGVKVLEWNDDDAEWRYIDDNTQNEVGGQYAGTIWAPNENEIYYAAAPAYVYHGERLTPPATGWSWSRQLLEDNGPKGLPYHDPTIDDHGYRYPPGLSKKSPALGVWGTGSRDVYAWYSNTVYHWKDEAGTPAWIPEYVADDYDSDSEHLFFVSAGGSGPSDVWFAGIRDQGYPTCALLVRKTPAGYRRIADGAIRDFTCSDREGYLYIGGANGWLTDIQSAAAGGLIGLKGTHDIVRVSSDGDTISVDLSTIPNLFSAGGPQRGYSSLWRSEDALWLTGWSLVARGASDGETYQVSTISLNGGPLATDMYRVRGTSSTNLWAIGNGYALHKTTL